MRYFEHDRVHGRVRAVYTKQVKKLSNRLIVTGTEITDRDILDILIYLTGLNLPLND